VSDEDTQQTERVPYVVRPYRGESGFVAGSWLRNYLSAPAVRHVDPDDYYKHHARLVSKLIDRSTVLIADHADHPAVQLGFAVGERDNQGVVIHYLYVKSVYRRNGIGKALWTALFDGFTLRGSLGQVRYTHARAPFTEIAAKQGWKYSFYPAFRQGWES
jgi:GNAT superfamily N-acetyltransferase